MTAARPRTAPVDRMARTPRTEPGGIDAGGINGDISQDAGSVTTVIPKAKDGCTANDRAPGPMGALFLLLFAALGLVSWRRRSEA